MMGADGSPGAGDASVYSMRRSHMEQFAAILVLASSVMNLAGAILNLVDRSKREGGQETPEREGGEGTAGRDAKTI
jgi:hypothetical protein